MPTPPGIERQRRGSTDHSSVQELMTLETHKSCKTGCVVGISLYLHFCFHLCTAGTDVLINTVWKASIFSGACTNESCLEEVSMRFLIKH